MQHLIDDKLGDIEISRGLIKCESSQTPVSMG